MGLRARLLSGALAALVSLQAAEWPSPQRLRADVRFLSLDLLEGRAPGTRGGRLAAEYIRTQFALAGLDPAGEDGTYFQSVPLAAVHIGGGALLRVRPGAGEPETFRWLEDFVGATEVLDSGTIEFAAPAVFAGYGIRAPEFRWDDYARTDVRGKLVVALTGKPHALRRPVSDGPGAAYYGTWVYKAEEARRRGAAALLLIPSGDGAELQWDLARAAWGGEVTHLGRDRPEALRFLGWLSPEAGERLLATAGRAPSELLEQAGRRGFRAVPLGAAVEFKAAAATRRIRSVNVAGVIPGSSPEHRGEAVVFLAHWDHLGVRPGGAGDRVYNGAVDNATGCAVLMEIARLWAFLEKKPARTALFLAVTASEGGSGGSAWYVKHPVAALKKTRLVLGVDSLLPAGTPLSVVLAGPAKTEVWLRVKDAARRLRLEIEADPAVRAAGLSCWSHYPFAWAGVPAFTVMPGSRIAGSDQDHVRALWQEFTSRRLHRPSDEFREAWDFAGLARVAEFAFLLGRMVAELP